MLALEPETGQFICVNGTRIYLCIERNGIVRLNESNSEQCEGCGDDIMSTGRHESGQVVCDCGAAYPIRRGEWRW